ncbi:ROK family protein [Actinotalea subterranea]|uniref:ROK family protein n=1 Tax=Actinotalea subterranea TaxID=2607497 RepID=UPI0011EEAA14|nr:ROK family protein [Actinotalea subterranea]
MPVHGAGLTGGHAGGPGRWWVGLDIGGTKVQGVLLDAAAVTRGAARRASVGGIDGVVESAARTVEELCAARGIELADLAGVGAGVPGLVEPATGIVSHAVNLGIDDDVPLGARLSARLGGVPVDVENDLNVAALGAARVLELRGDLAYLALGTGVAAGLVLDGRLRRGRFGAAGEIGHLPYVPDGAPCPCGQRGCLELYASGSALDAAWPSRGRPSPVEVFDAAAAGDPTAVAVRDRFVDAVAAAVRLLVLTCDPEHVLLGGGVSGVGTPLLDAVVGTVAAEADRSPFLRRLRVADRLALVPAGALVAPIGAALTVREGGPVRDTTEAVAWRS